MDYAFRAKNIHNRPQINTPVPKDTLLSELALEIENLKRNLAATRHRNGVYVTPDAHEEMTKEIESRRIINDEHKQRIQALESGLQRKGEELFAQTRRFRELESDNKQAHSKLEQMNDTLKKAQRTWNGSVAEVSYITEGVESRMKGFQTQQTSLLRDVSINLNQFLKKEMTAARQNQTLLHDTLLAVEKIGVDSKAQPLKGESEEAFHELKQVSKRVKEIVSEASKELFQAVTRISEGFQSSLRDCNHQVLSPSA